MSRIVYGPLSVRPVWPSSRPEKPRHASCLIGEELSQNSQEKLKHYFVHTFKGGPMFGKRLLTSMAVFSLAFIIALPVTSFGQGRGRWQGRGSNWGRKCDKFINCHDARDGRWDGRGARGDRLDNRFRRRSRFRDRRFDDDDLRRRRFRHRRFDDDYYRRRRNFRRDRYDRRYDDDRFGRQGFDLGNILNLLAP